MTTATADVQAEAAELFANATRDHTMTVLHEDGLYRHIRFSAPQSFDWFDLVTWPGRLTITGGHGTHAFARVTDMFDFFRHPRINPGYWAEKLVSDRACAETYSEEKARKLVSEALKDYEQAYPNWHAAYVEAQAKWDAASPEERHPFGAVRKPDEPKTPAEIRELVRDRDEYDGEFAYENGVRGGILRELEHHGAMSDTWELDLKDFDFHFLWCLHAIRWGVEQHDKAKAASKGAADAEA